MNDFAIAGIHALTTLDFPGVVSAIVFTQGCNFHCSYCHNPHLVPLTTRIPLLDTKEILGFLKKRVGLLDGLVISGGEPTLHAGLPAFCRMVKTLGYKIKLDTNGSNPEVLAVLLGENLLDYVAVDYKTAPEQYAPEFSQAENLMETLQKTAGLLASSGIRYEFRTTCVKPYVTEDCAARFARFAASNAEWFLQKANLDSRMQAQGMAPMPQESMKRIVEAAQALGIQAKIR